MRLLSSSRGYSLLEITTVTCVVAVVTAIAVPSLNALRTESGLPSAEREVMGALYMARSGAIAYNAPRSVIVTPSTKTIQIQDQSGTVIYTRSLSTYGDGLTIGSGSTLGDASGPVTITFDGRGLLTPATSTIIVRLNGPSNQTKTVTVYPTGKVVAS